MIAFTKRNIKLFFKDKTSVFFSLLSVFIIIVLYALFLGDVWTSSLDQVPDADLLMNTWVMAGLLTVTSVTTTMGAFGTMVDDRARKISKDFYSSPLSRTSITGGYIISAYLIGIIMSFVALILTQVYIVIKGGSLLSLIAIIKVLGLILLATLTNTSLVLFIVSFFRSTNAFVTASAILGTLIGFLTGIYLPISTMPDGVQTLIKVFPVSHSAALFRQVYMEDVIAKSFAGIPAQYLEDFKLMMGVEYRFGDYTVTPLVSILILLGTAVIFFLLSLLNMSRKQK